MSRYLVTGGCGFIGSHLVEHLVSLGHSVRVVDNLSTGRREALSAAIELIVADVSDLDAVRRAMADVDGCFHLAAVSSVEQCTRDWYGSHRTNLGGTLAVFEAAALRGVPVVYASSAAVYGDIAQMPISEASPTSPISAYGADKLACELHARVASLVHKVPTVGVRLFNVYGPRQDSSSPYSGVISLFCMRVFAQQPIMIHGDGRQVRDFIYVGDVVRSLGAAMAVASTQPRVFCICTGRPTSILEISALLGELFGTGIAVEHAPARRGDIRASVGDPRRARDVLDFSALVDLRTGLRLTLDWMESVQPVDHRGAVSS